MPEISIEGELGKMARKIKEQAKERERVIGRRD